MRVLHVRGIWAVFHTQMYKYSGWPLFWVRTLLVWVRTLVFWGTPPFASMSLASVSNAAIHATALLHAGGSMATPMNPYLRTPRTVGKTASGLRQKTCHHQTDTMHNMPYHTPNARTRMMSPLLCNNTAVNRKSVLCCCAVCVWRCTIVKHQSI